MPDDANGLAEDAFWARVHACLDTRRDPLDDPVVVRMLDDDPTDRGTRLLEELVELRASLASLESGVAVSPPSRGRETTEAPRFGAPVAASLAAAAVVFAAVLALPLSRSGTSRSASHRAEEPAPGILGYRIRTEHESEGRRVVTTKTPEGTERRVEFRSSARQRLSIARYEGAPAPAPGRERSAARDEPDGEAKNGRTERTSPKEMRRAR